ncbi:hypothetical protein Tco_1023605 [Tanacetum coccineum]
MTESSNPTQIPPQQEQNPQQEQQLESLIPFEPTPQVGFDIEDIIFNPNNFVALFYPPHTNSKYFKGVVGKLKQREPSERDFFLLGGDGVEIDFAKLIWEDFLSKLNKKSRNPRSFTKHMLGICIADVLVAFKAPKPSSKAEKEVTQGIKPRAKSRRRKSQIPFTYNHPQSKIETTKASTIIHFESASRHDASADLTAEVDLGKSAPNDSVYKQQDMDKGTQNYSLDHMFIGTNPSVLVDKTKSARDELKIAHTETDDIKKEIKLEDLSKLVQYVGTNFMDLDSPEDDKPIIVQDESDEEVHAKKVQTKEPKETEDASASHPPSPKTVKIQELGT